MQKLISLERLKDFLDCCKNLFFTENDIATTEDIEALFVDMKA